MYDVRIKELFIKIVNRFKIIEGMAIDFGGIGINLYPSEIHLIEVIGNYPEINITELADKMGVTKGAVSQIIKKIVKKDLVVKYKNSSNQKEVHLMLTPKGKSSYLGHEEYHKESDMELINYYSEMTIEQREFLQEFFERIDKIIEKNAKKAEIKSTE